MYKVNDKVKNIQELNDYMLAKTLGMFSYSGLPETIPQREIERLLQLNGYVFVTEHEGALYAFTGGMGGERDAYNLPTKINVSNPALGLNKTFDLKTDGVLITNDSVGMGLKPLFDRFNSLLVENHITMSLNNFNTRLTRVISAGDDRTKDSAESFLKKLDDGEMSVIGENAFFEGVKVHGSGGNSSPSITSLVEYHQYLKAALYSEVGINSPFNMKRERLNTAEVKQDSEYISVLVDNMLFCRKEGLEKLNDKYGLEINIQFAGVWKREANTSESVEAVGTLDVDGMDESETEETGAAKMKTQTIAEFLDGSNLWDAIDSVKPYPFITPDLNSLFLIEYGNMPLFSGIADDSVENIAGYCVRLFGDKWDSLLELSGVKLDVSETNTITETTVNTEERATERTDTDKVSAFNSAELIDEGGKASDGTESVEGETVRTVEDETKSMQTAFDNLHKSDKLNIIKQAIADVAGFMKVQVY